MPETSEQLLARFADAWDRRDVEAVVSCFASDGVYFASVGPSPGERAVGHPAIRKLVARMFDHDSGAKTEIVQKGIGPSGGYWSWIYSLPDGSIERGCDIITIADGRITLKDAYRKIK